MFGSNEGEFMKGKKGIFLLLYSILLVVLCGCSNHRNKEETLENMKQYASDKYGREFCVEAFQAAKDETYTNILTLNDGELVFNVYQSGDAEPSDDYAKAVVNKKFVDELKDKSEDGFGIYANFLFADGNTMSPEYAKDNDVPAVLEDYELLKVVVVVVVNEKISECSDELFLVYKEAMAFAPKYIDFEVIQVKGVGSELEEMLNNLPAFYDNNWKKHSEVEDYLRVTDTNISTGEELWQKQEITITNN